MANTLADKNTGFIYKMAFGNGGSAVDPTGVITYLPPNTTGQNASLYNETYSKVVDNNSAADTDPVNNYLTVVHTSGNVYTDIITMASLQDNKHLITQPILMVNMCLMSQDYSAGTEVLVIYY